MNDRVTESDPQPAESPPPAAQTEQFLRIAVRQIRRLAILVGGLTVVLVGVVMFVTPGPGLVVVPIGLGILALEFAWARRLLKHVRERAARVRDEYWNKR